MDEKTLQELIAEIRNENAEERSYLKKQNTMMRCLMAVMLGIFVILAIAVIVLVPKISMTLSKADTALTNANTTLTQVNELAKNAETTMSNLDTVLGQSSEGIASTMEKLNAIDFEGLNQSIEDLGNVVSPLSKFFGTFR